MSQGINKVTLIGNLGADPDVRAFPDGGEMVRLSVATTSTWKDRQTGERRSHTEWHRVVYRGRLAEIAREYLKQGSKIYVEGSNRTFKWTDRDGVERYTTQIIGRDLQMLDRRGDSTSSAGTANAQAANAGAKQSGISKKASSQSNTAPPPAPALDSYDFDDYGDDGIAF